MSLEDNIDKNKEIINKPFLTKNYSVQEDNQKELDTIIIKKM